ncbi:hypothetical protein HYH03_003174 [Edaphochlamys debaryana]|uniref:Dynamin N-terminal domain-containing protein n=1 Tax=Edaphochlamys debaryana TaxID=47281 RepID=A0A836C4K1_9CHLO|nr:hypothetical protein HYH03_003174 [Edaphochlamys debaryana]|eukprot:KAG2498988.1 hypothetical protein HYH03_003174 [Edaphochlamys debaryana]
MASMATTPAQACRAQIDALLQEFGSLLVDLTNAGDVTDPSNQEEDEEPRRVIDEQLQRFWAGYTQLKGRHEKQELLVAVLALTKSGKSTLLNSFLGAEVLPMNNVPETARIVRIVHDPSAKEPILREPPPSAPGAGALGSPTFGSGRQPAGTVIRGEAAIRARLSHLNSMARTSSGAGLSPSSSSGLTSLSSGVVSAAVAEAAVAAAAGEAAAADGEGSGHGAAGGDAGNGGGGGGALPSVLHISAPLAALEGFGPEFGRVVLLDTPGPNEAGEEQLKHQVERLLESVDCVLYLLDYTKLKTADEEGLFRRLKQINPQLVARLSSRLFFVINKVDAVETSEGLDSDEVRTYVADLVTRQLGGAASAASPSSSPSGTASGAAPPPPPFCLHPDQVLLLSARNALLARLVLSGRASADVTRRFSRLAFGAFGMGMGGMGVARGGAAAGPTPEQLRAAAGCLLEGSGLPDLEERVLAFLGAHAASVKMLATADDATRLLSEVRNVALTCRSCLLRTVEALRAESEAIRDELCAAQCAFEEVRERADAVQAQVVAEIRTHLNTLRRRLFTQIVQTLDTDTRAGAPSSPSSSSGRYANNPNDPSANGGAHSRWSRVREKFLSMFTSVSSSAPPGGAGPAGLIPEARSRSRDELANLVLDLHEDLMAQIQAEVTDFWGVLEACAASRHAELLAALNAHLAALSRRVEGAVSEALGVALAPVDIRLQPPSAEELHSDVAELIEKGIRETSEKHIRVATRTTTERRPAQGPPSLCRWGNYWVDVPRTRTVVETYTATVYCLKPDELANHFIGMVDGAISASERALGSHVGTMVERQLAAARERVRDYGDRYLSAMTSALSASARGAEHRAASLAAVEAYLQRLEGLAARAAEAQRAAEGAVPRDAAGLMDEVQVFDSDSEGEGQEQEEEQQEEGVQQQAEEEEEGREEAAEEEVGGEGQFIRGLGGSPEPEYFLDERQQQLYSAEADVEAADVEAGALLPEAPAEAQEEAVFEPEYESMPEDDEVEEEGLEGEGEGEFGRVSPSGSHVTAQSQEAEEGLEAEGEAGFEGVEVGAGGGGVVRDVEELLGQAASAEAELVAAAEAALAEAQASAAAVPSLAELAGAAVCESLVAPPPPPPLPAPEVVPPPAPEVVMPVPTPAQAVPAAPEPRAAVHMSGSMSASSYSGAPFDYTRGFLEAMTASDMASSVSASVHQAGALGTSAPAAGARAGSAVGLLGPGLDLGLDVDEPLTMIPLTSDGIEGGGLAAGGRAGGGSGGLDSPRSAGGSEEWQLVGMEAAAEAEAAGAGK